MFSGVVYFKVGAFVVGVLVCMVMAGCFLSKLLIEATGFISINGRCVSRKIFPISSMIVQLQIISKLGLSDEGYIHTIIIIRIASS